MKKSNPLDIFDCIRLSYKDTRQFSPIVLDYIAEHPALDDFYIHRVSNAGLKSAIEARKKFSTNRDALVEHLQWQYRTVKLHPAVARNIELLQYDNTFTVCTAHQPNLFTGHLYFIYKILHVVKLAAHCREQFPDKDFVPVFFMGSEDADLDELNHVSIFGHTYTWQTRQTGAVGQMIVDDQLVQLLDDAEGLLAVQPHGRELVTLLRQAYTAGSTIEQATFHFVNALFESFGLIVLLPNSKPLKNLMRSVFEDDLLNNVPGNIVKDSSGRLANAYEPQAFPRDINLFYLKDQVRNRIEQVQDKFGVVGTDVVFTKDELLEELQQHPNRFSPNVILRGLYQETILPNIAFVGGGGELAYWLQLADLFAHYKTPFPVLILRNSFLLIEEKWRQKMDKLEVKISDLFREPREVFEEIVRRNSQDSPRLTQQMETLASVYDSIVQQALPIDKSIERHIRALEKQEKNRLEKLEKKLFRAQKKKFEATQRQLDKLFAHLAPNGGLQERKDSFLAFYARWGAPLLEGILKHSPALTPEFTLLVEKQKPE